MLRLKKTALVACLCLLACLVCSCNTDGVWGLYTTEIAADGNYKSIECAYSKAFYTADALAASAQADAEENDALLEGWYTREGDKLICTFTVGEGEDTSKVVYTFNYDSTLDTLTLTGHTEDGKDLPIPENEVYSKENS